MKENTTPPQDIRIIVMSADELRQILEDFVARLMAMQEGKRVQTQDEDELIGTAEACRILGCSTRTMQRYRDSKLFNITMRGPHKALYYRSEILAFRENNLRKKR